MAPGDVPPDRPRRDRPLVAAGRERPAEPPARPAPPPAPPTATTPPTGPPVRDFPGAGEPLERDDHVEVAFAGPTLQRRWTVALRAFLVFPHAFWGGLLGYAAGFVTFLAWFAALFTGRVPEGMARFMGRVLQYQTRVYGYGYLLLTDEYPPFALEDNEYAIDVRTSPSELNRAAVFFRLVLMVPSAIVSSVLLAGAQLVAVVGWLLTLIMGRLPTPLWEANAAVLRYWARTYAFGSMLTAEQPSGAFGDPPGQAFASAGGDEVPELPARPQIVRLVLSGAAKRILVFFIVAAVVGYGGFVIWAGKNAADAFSAYEQLDDAYVELSIAYDERVTELESCSFRPEPGCQQVANQRFAGAFDAFVAEVENIEFPGVDVGPLLAEAERCAAALRAMAAAESEADYARAQADYRDAEEAFNAEYDYVAGP